MLSTLFELPRRTRPAHDHQVGQSAEQPTSSRTLSSVTPWQGEGTATRTLSAEVLFSFSLAFFLSSKKLRGEGGGEDSKTLNQNLANCSPFLKFVMLTWNFYSSIAKALSLKCFQIVPTNTKSVTSQLVDIRSSEFTGWTMRARLLSQLFHNWDSKWNRLVGMKV